MCAVKVHAPYILAFLGVFFLTDLSLHKMYFLAFKILTTAVLNTVVQDLVVFSYFR